MEHFQDSGQHVFQNPAHIPAFAGDPITGPKVVGLVQKLN